MCFSATSSFTVATALTGVGIGALYKAKSKSYYMHASIPIFFAIQQSIEGIVWLTFSNPSYVSLRYTAAYAFLMFAFLFWPVWLPSSLWVLEKNENRRQMLLILLGIGCAVAASGVYVLTMYPMTVGVVLGSIMYNMNVNHPLITHIHLFCYMLSTIAPFFIVSLKRARLLGIAFFASLLSAYIFMYTAFVSVWCFAAAIVSCMILFVIW